MKRLSYKKLFIAQLISAAVFLSHASAATYPTDTTVSPMPFGADQPFNIKATAVGPFSNVTEYISISDGTRILFEKRFANKGPVAKDASQPFSIPITLPAAARDAANLYILVVFLEGDESYIGENSTDRTLRLVRRCPARPSKVSCKYATGKYWTANIRGE